MKKINNPRCPRKEGGATVLHWLLALIPLAGFAALAVDHNNVYLSAGELQNAADAGALEGARLLYNPDGTINVGQNGTSAVAGATNTAQANTSQGTAAEIVSVNRGHWEFRTSQTDSTGIERGGVFTPNATTIPAPLVDANGDFRTWQDLNTDPNEINAVEVLTARQLTPIQAFFGQLLGQNNYQHTSRAVAYIGFAGSVAPGEFDFPIAMCEEILNEGCQVGRLVPEPDQSGGWTNIIPHDPGTCGGATDSNEMQTLISETTVCSGPGLGSPQVNLGMEIQVNNGQINAAFDDMYDCWRNNPTLDTDGDGWPDQPMSWTLPVVHGCQFGGQCATIIGAVQVDVLWMYKNNPNTSGAWGIDNTAPRAMELWSNTDADGIVRWNDFVANYALEMDSSHTPATFENGGAIQKTFYIRPGCQGVPIGGTGGNNYGVRATVPVLVR